MTILVLPIRLLPLHVSMKVRFYVSVWHLNDFRSRGILKISETNDAVLVMVGAYIDHRRVMRDIAPLVLIPPPFPFGYSSPTLVGFPAATQETRHQ